MKKLVIDSKKIIFEEFFSRNADRPSSRSDAESILDLPLPTISERSSQAFNIVENSQNQQFLLPYIQQYDKKSLTKINGTIAEEVKKQNAFAVNKETLNQINNIKVYKKIRNGGVNIVENIRS